VIAAFAKQATAVRLQAKGDRVNGADFLAKPFALATLAQRVREMLDAGWTEEPM
jgi:DNA-binding response OmpR family regulator